jgi:hypothetical protein
MSCATTPKGKRSTAARSREGAGEPPRHRAGAHRLPPRHFLSTAMQDLDHAGVKLKFAIFEGVWMSESGAYRRRLADRLHSESSRALVSRSLRKGVIGFTEIRSDNPTTDPIPREDAFLVALQYASSQSQILGRRPRQTPVFSLKGRYSGTDNEVGRRNRSRLINWGTRLNI